MRTILRTICILAFASSTLHMCMANTRSKAKVPGVRGSGSTERLLLSNETTSTGATSTTTTTPNGEQSPKNGRPGLISNALGNSNFLSKQEHDRSPSKGFDFPFVFNDEELYDSTEMNETINNAPIFETDKEEREDIYSKLEEGPAHSENGKQDCLWRVLTGTSCTSLVNGNIVNAEQHQFLVADGICRYNDFLGYYKAGCQRPATENENTFPGLAPTKAKLILTNVFCADSECSFGCHENAMIESNFLYTSNFCYLSNGLDKVDGDGKDKAEQRIDDGFSFEFIGGCLESENCNVVE